MTPFIENRQLLQDRIVQAVEAARAQPEVDAAQVAATGYCFGGLVVLDLARTGCDVLGVVSLHCLFMPPDNVANQAICAKVLCPAAASTAISDCQRPVVYNRLGAKGALIPLILYAVHG